MKNKVFKELVKQLKDIPSPIKEQMIAFARRNSYKVWKEYLMLLYDKYSKKQPKHLGKYLENVIRRIKKIERKSNFGGVQRDDWENPQQFGKKKIKRKRKMKKKVPESLKKKCRKLKVRLTVKRGKKRVYKSEKVLKKQCKTAMKKKKKVKRKKKFGASRKGHRVVPILSNGFGRPYFGYVTSSRQSRFGSRRPEFHYPEHILKGYNTAKTNKKFRFGRPHRHPLRYSHYNPAKTDKKYRFGRKLSNKAIAALIGTGGIALGHGGTRLYDHFRRKPMNKGFTGPLIGVNDDTADLEQNLDFEEEDSLLEDNFLYGKKRKRRKKKFGRKLTKKELMALSGLGGLGLGVGGTLGYQYFRPPPGYSQEDLATLRRLKTASGINKIDSGNIVMAV
jgi:hypothetical protein